MPMHVEKALNEGYTIVHKGLLCWSSIPTAALQPRIRLLFVALDTAFSCILGNENYERRLRHDSHLFLACQCHRHTRSIRVRWTVFSL
jgi:hypothetical protein